MAGVTVAVALAKAKGDAEDRLKEMTVAAEYIMEQKIVSSSDDLSTTRAREITWSKIRVENNLLLSLRDDQFFIGEELKKAQNRFDDYNSKADNLMMSIALLTEALDLVKRGKTRSAKAFEIKVRKKEMEIESIKNEIAASNFLRTHPSSGESAQTDLESLTAKNASLEEKMRRYREREASESASFDSKIRESDVKLRKKTSKLNRTEPNLAVAGETLKLMKDASRRCEEAIAMFQLVFINRLRKLKANFIEVDGYGEVAVIKRIYGMKDRFKGFQLNFFVSNKIFCPKISRIYRGIDVKLDKLYNLSIDEGGMCHIRQLPYRDAVALGFTS